MSHEITVTGAPPDSSIRGSRPHARRPIEQLIGDERQFSLYVQAIDAMMKAPSSNMLSWYQIAGIHGAPATPWDKVQKTGANARGYCAHASSTFPTWHRPYLLLFEQSLVQNAVRIAGTYTGTDAAEWRQAALALRAPYWDWAINPIPPKEVIELATLTVTGPKGKVTFNPNPLLGYVYKRDDPRIDSRPSTVRCPSSRNPNQTDLRALKTSLQILDNPNDPMRDRVYNALADAATWDMFSNKRTALSRFRNSVESVHDDIHVLVGGNGQMSDPGLAAFDPIFWLHHVNVDRLISLWQAMHPNSYVSKGTGTQSLHSGTDLLPFWSGPNSFHDSDDVRNWERLGYTYPEFKSLPVGADARAKVTEEVRKLYLDDEDAEDDDDLPAPPATKPAPAPAAPVAKPAPAPAAPAAKPAPAAAPAPAPAPAAKPAAPPAPAPVAQPAPAPAAPAPVVKPTPNAPAAKPAAPAPVKSAPQPPAQVPISAPGHSGEPQDTDAFPITVRHDSIGGPHQRLDWFIRIRVPIGAVDQSFTVLFFFGDAPESEHDWRSAQNLVGVHAEFENAAPGECINCTNNRADGVVTEGIVRLTRALRLRQLYGRPTAEIDQYLRDQLTWRIQKIDATIVEPSAIEGLEVSVMTVALEFSQERHGWRKIEGVRPSHRDLTEEQAGGRHRRREGHAHGQGRR